MASASVISTDNGRTLEWSGTLERTAGHSAAGAVADRRETCVAADFRWMSAYWVLYDSTHINCQLHAWPLVTAPLRLGQTYILDCVEYSTTTRSG